MGIIAGLDGGGTKTVCRIKETQHDTTHFKECFAGPSNPKAVGMTASLQTAAELLDKTLSLNARTWKEVDVIVAGMAGLRTKEEKENYQTRLKVEILNSYYSEHCEINVENDAFIALRADIPPLEPGILLVSGTGSIAYGIDDAQTEWRSGGWGWLIGDEGSGWWIGKNVLSTAVAAFDKRNGAEDLLQAVLAEWNLEDAASLSTMLYQSKDPRLKIAGLTRLAARMAEKGDAVSIKLLEEAGQHLSHLLSSVLKQSDDFPKPVQVVFHGSVVEHIPIVRKAVEKNMESGRFKISSSEGRSSPVEGALRIARHIILKNRKDRADDC